MIDTNKTKDVVMYLNEAAQWVEQYLDADDIENSLRSEVLKPTQADWSYGNIDQYVRIEVNRIQAKRKKVLALTEPKINSGLSGRILCFYPELSMKDAIASKESNGYFDDSDCPPWDTWFYYDTHDIEGFHDEEYSCLLSWVPHHMTLIISQAIAADTYGCLVWAKNLYGNLNIDRPMANK